jgi:spore coat protein U-like protein
MTLRELKVTAVALGLVVAAAPVADAATASANLTVTATVVSTCSVGAGSLAFGNYDPTAASNVDQAGTFQVTCTKGTSATVGLDTGSNASGSTRRMTDGTDFLSYELFKETARTNVWGNSGAGLVALAAAPSNAAQTVTVYGRISGSQDVRAGSYSDTVIITVTF